jgi:hypothetical protein
MKGLPIKQYIKVNYENIEAAMYGNEALNASIDESCDACIVDESEQVNQSRSVAVNQSRSVPVDKSWSGPLLYNENINKNLNNNMSDFDFEQNDFISSVPHLGNSSVQKPKVFGRVARKPIQEIVAPDPHLIILTDLERIGKKFYPNNKITPPQLKTWLSEIKKLFKGWCGSVDDLHQMLRTYYTYYDRKNKYHVVIRSGSSLKEKINQLESFCDRLQTDSKPTVKKYQENFKSDTKGKYDNIKIIEIDMDEED